MSGWPSLDATASERAFAQHEKVESIERELLARPHRDVFFRGVPIENFSHDALVVIAGEFLRMGRFL